MKVSRGKPNAFINEKSPTPQEIGRRKLNDLIDGRNNLLANAQEKK